MISSPILRSAPTLKSAESESPSAGRLFCAAAGCSTALSASARAQVQATARRSKSRSERRGGESGGTDGRRGGGGALRKSASLSCIGIVSRFVSLPETLSR